MSFAGAITGAIGEPPFLVIDLGGGSTEFVHGVDRVESGVSVDIGSVRLTERMLPNRPAPSTAVEAARRHVAGLFTEQVTMTGEIATVIGVGGTFTSLAAIHLGLEEYDAERVHGTVVPVLGFDILVDELARLDLVATVAIPSLDPARAPCCSVGRWSPLPRSTMSAPSPSPSPSTTSWTASPCRWRPPPRASYHRWTAAAHLCDPVGMRRSP